VSTGPCRVRNLVHVSRGTEKTDWSRFDISGVYTSGRVLPGSFRTITVENDLHKGGFILIERRVDHTLGLTSFVTLGVATNDNESVSAEAWREGEAHHLAFMTQWWFGLRTIRSVPPQMPTWPWGWRGFISISDVSAWLILAITFKDFSGGAHPAMHGAGKLAEMHSSGGGLMDWPRCIARAGKLACIYASALCSLRKSRFSLSWLDEKDSL
ncbi:hypothetical protein BHE74_00049111, partial [Ensete ventricosum]